MCEFYSAATRKASINAGRCWGCGICRAGCANDAITLKGV